MTKSKGSLTMVAMICCLLCLLLGVGYGISRRPQNPDDLARRAQFNYSAGVAEVQQTLLHQAKAPSGYIRITNSGSNQPQVPFIPPAELRVPAAAGQRGVGY